PRAGRARRRRGPGPTRRAPPTWRNRYWAATRRRPRASRPRRRRGFPRARTHTPAWREAVAVPRTRPTRHRSPRTQCRRGAPPSRGEPREQEYRGAEAGDAGRVRPRLGGDAEPQPGGAPQPPQEVAIALDAFAGVVHEAEAVDQVPGVAERDVRIVRRPGEADGARDPDRDRREAHQERA